MARPHPPWCCMPLLWRDTGQVSGGRPGEQTVYPIQRGQFVAPPRYQHMFVPLTHVHSDTKPCLYIRVHPERLLPTCLHTPGCIDGLHTDTLRDHLPPAPSVHAHSHSVLNTLSPREQHVNTCTLAYPETHIHSYSHMCTYNTPTTNTYIHPFARMCLYTGTPTFNHIHKNMRGIP